MVKKLLVSIWIVFYASTSHSQSVCNQAGDLMIFTNYDGGTLNINVDQNIPNLKIGICSYEAVNVVLSGAFVGNVVAVRYAGYNGTNNTSCVGGTIPTTTISGAPLSAAITTVFAPPSPLANSFGYGTIICGYSCANNVSQGGCNTVDQIEAYFLNYFSGSVLFAHRVQYGCWTGTQNLSSGGNCCPPIAVVPGVISASQTLCAGQTPSAFTSVSAATGGSGTITYTWQSSTTSTNSGFTNIATSNNAVYSAGALSTTTYYRRAASTSANNISYSNVIAITVNPNPNIMISGASGVCPYPGASIILTASGGVSYTWTPGNLTFNQISVGSNGVGTYTLLGLSANNCSATAVKQVSLHTLPNITTTGPASMCINASASYTASGALSYTWLPTLQQGAIVNISSSASISNYTVVGTAQNSCTNSSVFQVGQFSAPMFSIGLVSSTFCEGEGVTLIPVGANTYTLLPLNISTIPITYTPIAAADYTLVATDVNLCVGTSTFSLPYFTRPVISFTVATQPVCSGKTASLLASGANNYTWMPGNYTGSSVSFMPDPIVVYTIIGADQNCSNSSTLSLNVLSTPTLVITASKERICSGEETKLQAAGANTYSWSYGSISVINASLTTKPLTTTQYSLLGSLGNGCDNMASVTISVSACTGILDAKNNIVNEFDVFPNPNNGEFIVKGSSDAIINIVNVNGVLIESVRLNPQNHFSVKITGLTAGIYILCSEKDPIKRRKVVVTE